jgi:acyl carrier protein phosphodiesterase
MNFLGHLYFSNNNLELMYANLFGDHVKGSDYSHFPEIVQTGISLHRSIDNYIDHHPKVVELMHKLYPELPKVTVIAMTFSLTTYWPFIGKNFTHLSISNS